MERNNRDYALHVQRLREAKGVLGQAAATDDRWKKRGPKRENCVAVLRKREVALGNARLLHRLDGIFNAKDCPLTSKDFLATASFKPTNRERRVLESRRITGENVLLAKRLDGIRPTLNRTELQAHTRASKQLAARIARHEPPSARGLTLSQRQRRESNWAPVAPADTALRDKARDAAALRERVGRDKADGGALQPPPPPKQPAEPPPDRRRPVRPPPRYWLSAAEVDALNNPPILDL
ncbi:hypothetical protein DIPPA_28501 [Diplonema papillatum]|nr:hypothetical protein DIPPA_28501 [Diplonema papillatum]